MSAQKKAYFAKARARVLQRGRLKQPPHCSEDDLPSRSDPLEDRKDVKIFNGSEWSQWNPGPGKVASSSNGRVQHTAKRPRLDDYRFHGNKSVIHSSSGPKPCRSSDGMPQGTSDQAPTGAQKDDLE